MTPRPQGYREPTEEEMEGPLPEGTKAFYNESYGWLLLTGPMRTPQPGFQYAVPIIVGETVDELKQLRGTDPMDVQVGGGHYKDFAIQPAEFIHRNKLGFLEGCVVKRVCRHKSKNKAEDLRKAIHELELLLKLEYGEGIK